MKTQHLSLSPLQAIEYETRDLGYGSECGALYGYLTDQTDRWGKRTILVLLESGDLQPWYLFADEYHAEPAGRGCLAVNPHTTHGELA